MQDIIFLEKYSRTWSTNRWKSRWRKICRVFSLRCGQMRRSFMRYRSARPPGEVLPKVPYRSGGRREFVFIFEQTRVSIDYRLTGRRQGNQLIYLRFSNAAQGIWTINVYPQSIVTGITICGFPCGILRVEMFFPAVKSESYDHRAG